MRKSGNLKIQPRKMVVAIVLLAGFCFILYSLGVLVIRGLSRVAHDKYVTSLKVTSVSFDFEDIYSSSLKNELTTFLHRTVTDEKFLSFDSQPFYHEVKQAFPMVKDMAWNRVAPHAVQGKISGVKPQLLINEHQVLGENKQLFDRSVFQEYALDSLKSISVAHGFCTSMLDPHVYEFCMKIPQEHWEQFTIHYHAASHIYLHPKQTAKHWSVLADEQSFFKSDCFQRLPVIMNDLEKKGLSWKKYMVVFDLRFHNRIVVKKFFKSRGGN